MAIWRDLVDDHGFPAQYASVRRFVITLRGNTPVAIQNDVQVGTALPPYDDAFLVGFEDRLASDTERDNDFNDHIFLFEGAVSRAVPNPGVIWLLGMGLIGLAIRGRYRTRK
jgi:hypothetical protein